MACIVLAVKTQLILASLNLSNQDAGMTKPRLNYQGGTILDFTEIATSQFRHAQNSHAPN